MPPIATSFATEAAILAGDYIVIAAAGTPVPLIITSLDCSFDYFNTANSIAHTWNYAPPIINWHIITTTLATWTAYILKANVDNPTILQNGVHFPAASYRIVRYADSFRIVSDLRDVT